MRKQKKITEVQIVEKPDKSNIEVHFTYDATIVNIMRQLKGRYQKLPIPHWQFPKKEKEEVIRTLRAKRLCVRLFQQKPTESKTSIPSADIISVLGYCPNCNTYGFYYINGLNKNKCGKCV